MRDYFIPIPPFPLFMIPLRPCSEGGGGGVGAGRPPVHKGPRERGWSVQRSWMVGWLVGQGNLSNPHCHGLHRLMRPTATFPRRPGAWCGRRRRRPSPTGQQREQGMDRGAGLAVIAGEESSTGAFPRHPSQRHAPQNRPARADKIGKLLLLAF